MLFGILIYHDIHYPIFHIIIGLFCIYTNRPIKCSGRCNHL